MHIALVQENDIRVHTVNKQALHSAESFFGDEVTNNNCTQLLVDTVLQHVGLHLLHNCAEKYLQRMNYTSIVVKRSSPVLSQFY